MYYCPVAQCRGTRVRTEGAAPHRTSGMPPSSHPLLDWARPRHSQLRHWHAPPSNGSTELLQRMAWRTCHTKPSGPLSEYAHALVFVRTCLLLRSNASAGVPVPNLLHPPCRCGRWIKGIIAPTATGCPGPHRPASPPSLTVLTIPARPGQIGIPEAWLAAPELEVVGARAAAACAPTLPAAIRPNNNLNPARHRPGGSGFGVRAPSEARGKRGSCPGVSAPQLAAP